MAEFGLFSGAYNEPDQTYEGDRMVQDKEYVYIYKKEQPGSMKERQVAAVKLGPGQSVKEIE